MGERMVERVAITLFLASSGNVPEKWHVLEDLATRGEFDWGSRGYWRDLARAAIAAMREDVGRWAFEASGCEEPGNPTRRYMLRAIDAALNEL